MINPEMVPQEVCLALKATLFSGPGHDIYATAIAAALNAWPGMHTHEWQRPWLGGMSGTDLILPLAQKQETHND